MRMNFTTIGAVGSTDMVGNVWQLAYCQVSLHSPKQPVQGLLAFMVQG